MVIGEGQNRYIQMDVGSIGIEVGNASAVGPRSVAMDGWNLTYDVDLTNGFTGPGSGHGWLGAFSFLGFSFHEHEYECQVEYGIKWRNMSRSMSSPTLYI